VWISLFIVIEFSDKIKAMSSFFSKKPIILIIIACFVCVLAAVSVYADLNEESNITVCADSVTQPSCYSGSSPTPTLNWTISSDADGMWDASSQEYYQVQIDNNKNFNSPLIDTGWVDSTDASYTVGTSELSFGDDYYWQVRIKDDYGSQTDWSYIGDPDAFTTAGYCPPAAPSDLSATDINCNQIDLSWTDNSDNEDGFEIQRKVGAGGSWTYLASVAADAISYSDTTVSEDTTYYYRVYAYNDGGNSDYSNEANDATPQCTLSVALSVDPSSGSGYAPLNDVDLTATVTSNIPGTINYTFYCNRSDSGTDITSGWAAKYDGVTDNPKTAADVCDYATYGDYTAKVIAERGSLAAEDRQTITVLTNPPSVSFPLDALVKGDYCSIPVHYFKWIYSDPDGDDQSKFQFQMDNNSDFSSLEIDRTVISTVADGEFNNQTVIVAVSPGPDQIGYSTAYYWRVKVWDSQDIDSGWICYGGACPGAAFTTELHRYPTIDFSWSPQEPSQDEDILFTDQSIIYGGATKSTWSWTFEDGNPASSSGQDPTIQFTSNGSKEVSLQVTDSDGLYCSVSKNVGIQAELPGWQEILPQ